jgi:hypothetical protein
MKEDDSDSRAHLRARNRKAAAKFRVRKKGSIKQLQEKEATVREIYCSLSQEASQLQEEVLHLKNVLLEHSCCGCPRIDNYIQQAAATLAQGKAKPTFPSRTNQLPYSFPPRLAVPAPS